ncbi:MAG: DUF4255 domain-containing protein [Symploca sp. SIO1C4]|uniref:DUF4255 domain-containing protein n=1 Tax=Symploca sp. SIO1C4 TaxID=2607765 RepID=A0A6B3N7J9_9CYAN|nr:DUF4255 domain-containing protein [Symploca sp. SIO1C4]
MIRDLTQVLRKILEDSKLSPRFPELGEAQISFDRPSDTFSPGQSTVNLFLYDIRENLELRSNEPTIERRNGQAIIHNPPMRVACSYVITAWPVGGEELPLQEHRLLSQVLQVFSAYPTIPSQFLENTLLAGQEPPLPMVISQVDGLKNPGEFWAALGNQLRPSIAITVTISMSDLPELVELEEAPIVITRDLRFTQEIDTQQNLIPVKPLAPAHVSQLFRIGGRITDANSNPIINATVILIEQGLTAATDAKGYYSIGAMPAGNYTLRVKFGNVVQEEAITIPVETATSDYNVQLAQ